MWVDQLEAGLNVPLTEAILMLLSLVSGSEFSILSLIWLIFNLHLYLSYWQNTLVVIQCSTWTRICRDGYASAWYGESRLKLSTNSVIGFWVFILHSERWEVIKDLIKTWSRQLCHVISADWSHWTTPMHDQFDWLTRLLTYPSTRL